MSHAFNEIEATKLLRVVGLVGTDQRRLGEWAAARIEQLDAALEDAIETLEAMNLADNPLYERLRAIIDRPVEPSGGGDAVDTQKVLDAVRAAYQQKGDGNAR